MNRFLEKLEAYGNRIPHPTLLFVVLAALMIVISAPIAWLHQGSVHPVSQESFFVRSLLSSDGLRFILSSMVSNFTGFAPLGTVLVAMLGIGIAENSGFLNDLLQRMVKGAKPHVLTFIVALTGVLSSIAFDAGYVVLIPLSALLFIAANRSPVAGIATAFAGVSAGYSANLLLTPLDAVLSGLSSSAAQIIEPSYQVSVSANWYFNALSTLFLALVITLITERKKWPGFTSNTDKTIRPETSNSSMKSIGIMTVFFVLAILALSLPSGAPLRHATTDSLMNSPLSQHLVILVAFYFALAGIIYGKQNGRFENAASVIEAMEDTMRSMAPYLVMMFFAAQFIAYFQWSNIGLVIAINGADWLKGIELNIYVLLILFMLVTGLIDLLVGSASAKWAMMAPVFIPMFMLLGISPEMSQQAYRIGDSCTNIISPLMPYFALVLGFLQQHQKNAGVGTLVATMLPYSAILWLTWSALFIVYLLLDLPLGF